MLTGHTTALLAAGLSLVVLLVAATSGVSAHGWVLDVDNQVSDEGTVVVTKLSAVEHVYVAIHVVENGSPGRVIGHTHVDHGEFVNLEIAIDDGAWANLSGATELVAVVHEDDGNGEFDYPDGDPILESQGSAITSRFIIEKSDAGSSRVVATRHQSAGTVTIDRVDLARDGFLVIYDDANGDRGEVVGVRHLHAGHHENVTVAVDPRYFNQQQSRLYLVAGLHYDDGDHAWDQDPAVTAGDTLVTSAFDAEKTTAYIETATPTETPTASSTPSPTASETPSPTVADTVSVTPTPSAAAETATETTTTGTPGFGLLAVFSAIALATLFVGSRRQG